MNFPWFGTGWRKRGIKRRLAEQSRYTFALKIGIPASEIPNQHQWGDFHYASALQMGLGRLGHRVLVQCMPQWDERSDREADVVIHIFGLSYYRPKASHLNILWVISHPEKVTESQVRGFDLVLAASQPFAEQLRKRYGVDAYDVPQFTEPGMFRPGLEHGQPTDLLFVGNSRRTERPIVRWATQLEPEHSLALYGGDWEGLVEPRFVKSKYLPYEELGGWYAKAFAVLNDHWPDMRREGFINNRILDATAAGAFVISDAHSELQRLFPSLPCCESREQLKQVLKRAADEPEWRAAVIKDCRERTLGEFTLEKRTEQLISLIHGTR